MSTIQPEDWVKVPAEFAEAYQHAGHWTGDLLGDIAAGHAKNFPHTLAVVDGTHRWDYATLEAEALTLAAGWLAAGIGPRNTALVQLPNCAQFVSVLLSLWKVGAVPVMALPAHRLSELGGFADQAGISAFVSTAKIADFDQCAAASELRAKHPHLRHVVVESGSESSRTAVETAGNSAAQAEPTHDWRLTYEDLKALGAAAPVTSVTSPELSTPSTPSTPSALASAAASAPAELAASGAPTLTQLPPLPLTAPIDPFDVALLQLSGGSTGTPKLIPRTHADYLYSVRESVRVCGLDRDSVYLCVLPSAHNFALSSAGILGQLVAGGVTVMAPDPSPRTCFDLIERERVTITGVVPPIALLWLSASRRVGEALRSLRVLQVGGAKLSLEVAKRVAPELGCTLQQVFGMAEGLVNYTRLEDPVELAVSTQGRPMSASDEVRVVDDFDVDVPDGVAGHLLTRGPYTIRGYFRAPEHNRVAFTEDGFYRTGDVVVRSAGGYLTVVGRSKDQVNRGGEKIATEEVENHLLAHPSIFEAAVVGEPDLLLGERLVARIVPVAGEQGLLWASSTPAQVTNDIRNFLRSRNLATYKLPDQVHVVSDLPRTAVGKTNVAHLRHESAGAGVALNG